MALQKKLEQAKAQLERKATKPAKRKVSSLERKRFLVKRCSVISGSKKRQAPTERDLPTAKRSRKLSKRQLSTRLGASEEDKQLLPEQLTNAQDMVKKLRTENLSLKIKLRNIEQTQQNAKKQNEELKTVVKGFKKSNLATLTSLRSQIHSSTCVDYPLNNSIFSGIACILTGSDVIIYRL